MSKTIWGGFIMYKVVSFHWFGIRVTFDTSFRYISVADGPQNDAVLQAVLL